MSKLSRIGWGSLAALFLLTSVTFSILAIVQMTKKDKTVPDQNALTRQCATSAAEPAARLQKPQIYIPNSKIDKLGIDDLQGGSGPKVKSGDCVIVKYFGQLVDGTVFDQNFDQPTALKLALGQGTVITGWELGLINMQAGATRRLLIPPSLGYGTQAQPGIPANSPLIFTVKLLRVN